MARAREIAIIEPRRKARILALVLLAGLAAGCARPEPSADADPVAFGTPCADLRITADPPEIVVGEIVTFRLSLLNCGHPPIAIRPSGMCFRDEGLGIYLPHENATYYLYEGLQWNNVGAVEGASGPPMDLAFWAWSQGSCLAYGDRPPTRLVLAEGETHVDELAWNGTLHRRAHCPTESSTGGPFEGYSICPEPIVATPGTYTVYANFTWLVSGPWEANGTWQQANATTNVTLRAREGSPSTSFDDFVPPHSPPTRDPPEPLDFDPALLVDLARGPDGVLDRSGSYALRNGTYEYVTPPPQEAKPPCEPTAKRASPADADVDGIEDELEAYVRERKPELVNVLVQTTCPIAWNDILELRSAAGTFAVNAVWGRLGFAADLTPEQIGALAQRDDVRRIEPNRYVSVGTS